MSERHPGAQPAPTALAADDPYEIGGYRLHARLGAGGTGVVYLAYTPGGRPIAPKAVRRAACPDRQVVQIAIDNIAAGGGGIHCATQSHPAVPPAA